MNLSTQDIESMPIKISKDWKFGLITREVYRISKNKFELNETNGQWVTAKVDLNTMIELVNGKKSVLELDWK